MRADLPRADPARARIGSLEFRRARRGCVPL
jgi:hypothetical protein